MHQCKQGKMSGEARTGAQCIFISIVSGSFGHSWTTFHLSPLLRQENVAPLSDLWGFHNSIIARLSQPFMRSLSSFSSLP